MSTSDQPNRVPYHETPVLEFHAAFGHPINYAPTVPPIDVRLLRIKLIAEELTELAEATGVKLRIEHKTVQDNDGTQLGKYEIDVWPTREEHCNLVEAADALGDLRYVVDGGTLVYGIPGEAVLAEIHRSNMSKLGEDGKPVVREDGKILKGPGYFKPNITRVLLDQEVRRAQQG